jgi:UDPglucose 6-dehydrogenase
MSSRTAKDISRRPSIGIVGYGVVGRSLHQLFGDDAVTYDQDGAVADRKRINACRVTFVCVPTPMKADGSCDTSIVDDCVGWIESPYIVIRSTVTPGTTDRLRRDTGKSVLFQPEHLGETVAHPMANVRSRQSIVLGGPLADCSAVADVYKKYYHSELQFHFTSSLAAEMTKYMENAFFAVKVTFCNEFFAIAEAHGVDFNELRELWLADPRINRDHTFVYPDNRGFSGKCLPKDVCAIIHSAARNGCDAALLKAVMAINDAYRADDPAYDPNRFRK